MSPVLLAVAHGSRDPAAQACVRSRTGHVARLADGIRVRTGFVQHATPSLATALADAVTEAGTDGGSKPAVVPLLLSGGYHLSYDITAAAHPTVDEAVTVLASLTGKPVAVAAYLLAPGLFHDRLWLGSGTWVSAPLGDHPAVADLIMDRFRGLADQVAREALAGARCS